MKALLTTILLFFVMVHSNLSAQSSAGDIAGKWKNPNGQITVEIYKENDLYQGKVIESSNKSAETGTIYFSDIIMESTGNWKGTMLARGRKLPCTFSLKDAGTLSITISAMGKSRTMEWKRV